MSTIPHTRCGSGYPMVFFHNAGSDRELWSKQIEFFSRYHEVFAVDLPGFGEGAPLQDAASLQQYAMFVKDALSALNLQQPILVGHCIGASMVLAATLNDTTLARALILFNVTSWNSMKVGNWGGLIRLIQVAPWIALLFSRIMAIGPVAWRRASIRGLYENPEDEYFDKLVKMNSTPKHIASFLNFGMSTKSYAALDDFQRPNDLPPVQLFWGAKNKVLPLHTTQPLLERLKPDHWHPIENVGHMTMREAGTQVNELMLKFCSSVLTDE